MLGLMGWILLLTLAVIAGPAVGLLLGLGAAAAVVATGDMLRGERGQWRGELACLAIAARGAGLPPTGRNLPGCLLRGRERLFCVECRDPDAGPRVYLVGAKDGAAAWMKARAWGTHVTSISEITDPRLPTTNP